MKNLKNLRKKNNLTMKQLGEKIGLTESTISLYESDKREPDFKMLIKIARLFGVSLEYLLGVENIGYSEEKNTIKEVIEYLLKLSKGQGDVVYDIDLIDYALKKGVEL